MFREVTEITMQTIQCYRSNRYLGRAWVRHVGAFALVLNCWSTPLIRAIVHREDEGFARFLCLAVDIILDFWSSTLTPLIVGYGDFDLAMNKMSANFARSPYFFAQFHSDLQLGIPTSWLALLAQNFPSATMISSLNSMKLLIASRDAAVVPSYKPSSHRRSSTTFREIPVVKERKWFFRMLQVVHVLLALHGVVIFVFHMLATVNDPAANSVACQMPLKP
ncbi:TPA: hypothetical protein N0F65_005290 [Lagenidium giganteum]|uniref:Uncharacterized protein n=1 Tax=Lagenidium giganteum TaxID=4803 RepID=A0AAV2Z1C6_9STRA|nr:TPA: hypothetical protein N0F65_005290 [Lagenidium giganteum]